MRSLDDLSNAELLALAGPGAVLYEATPYMVLLGLAEPWRPPAAEQLDLDAEVVSAPPTEATS
jgi:hypothetical protein